MAEDADRVPVAAALDERTGVVEAVAAIAAPAAALAAVVSEHGRCRSERADEQQGKDEALGLWHESISLVVGEPGSTRAPTPPITR
jgi:hypothetical protein